MTDLKGFYKVAENGGSLITNIFYNPDTNEVKSVVVRDYDYSDRSRDIDELYYMPINEAMAVNWKHSKGIILVGDNAKVVKGRKMPIGYTGKVKRFFDYKDGYGRTQATYIIFEDGQKTNINNCVLVNE